MFNINEIIEIINSSIRNRDIDIISFRFKHLDIDIGEYLMEVIDLNTNDINYYNPLNKMAFIGKPKISNEILELELNSGYVFNFKVSDLISIYSFKTDDGAKSNMDKSDKDSKSNNRNGSAKNKVKAKSVGSNELAINKAKMAMRDVIIGNKLSYSKVIMSLYDIKKVEKDFVLDTADDIIIDMKAMIKKLQNLVKDVNTNKDTGK